MKIPGRVVVLLAAFASAAFAEEPSAKPLPHIASDKPDAWGVPTRTANKLVLRRMLFERRFVELATALEGLQAMSDADCQLELVGLDAFEAFQSADPNLEPLLNEFVTSSPNSYAPLLARGSYGVARAWAGRGNALASKTTEAQWKAMRDAMEVASKDLETSLEMHPTLTARRSLMQFNSMTSTTEAPGEGQLELGLKQCPGSLQMHIKAIMALTPRWGGSYEEMKAYAANAPVSVNPRLKVLEGAVEYDKCSLAKKPTVALEHCRKALLAGPYWEYLNEKAHVLSKLRRFPEALVALEQAIAQRPQKARVHIMRAYVLYELSRDAEGKRAEKLAMDLDPFDPSIPK